MSQMRSFFEMEKDKNDQRIQEDKDRFQRRLSQIQEELE